MNMNVAHLLEYNCRKGGETQEISPWHLLPCSCSVKKERKKDRKKQLSYLWVSHKGPGRRELRDYMVDRHVYAATNIYFLLLHIYSRMKKNCN